MDKFYEHLCAMTTLLGIEPVMESLPLPAHNSLKSVLQSLVHLPPTKQRAVVSDLKEKRSNILDNQQNMKRDFRLLWNLYTIFQQRATTQAIFSLDQSRRQINDWGARRCFVGIHQTIRSESLDHAAPSRIISAQS
jgi:hypothetical protein